MGFLDNVPFLKKKEDPFALPPAGNSGINNDPFAQPGFSSQAGTQDPYGSPQQGYGQSPYPQTPYPSPQSYPSQSPLYPAQQSSGMESFSAANQRGDSRDMELIRAKMDAIQATLDSLNQRFAVIERYINENARRRW